MHKPAAFAVVIAKCLSVCHYSVLCIVSKRFYLWSKFFHVSSVVKTRF